MPGGGLMGKMCVRTGGHDVCTREGPLHLLDYTIRSRQGCPYPLPRPHGRIALTLCSTPNLPVAWVILPSPGRCTQIVY